MPAFLHLEYVINNVMQENLKTLPTVLLHMFYHDNDDQWIMDVQTVSHKAYLVKYKIYYDSKKG